MLLEPTCPGPIRPGQVCTGPLVASFTVLDATGQPVSTFETDAAGHFEVALAPGTYTIVPDASAGLLDVHQRKEVVVQAGEVVQVTFIFDSGIR